MKKNRKYRLRRLRNPADPQSQGRAAAGGPGHAHAVPVDRHGLHRVE